MKVNWTQFLELQFDREELEGAGEHNFRGSTGGIKCTYHTLVFSQDKCGQNPQKKVFWNRITGTELLASLAMMMG